ncbi:hypothetical protein fugu_014360 [Takifugu bimaculatus]|uniref:LRRNT domain-containing protein n=1 Tax=Takifugu bimaculatus TaxID=433685 RepID=A0A4Z2C163_9TELE|nr:hypothetical protein fugu_014360 [Takifugu bimaculatus]
MATSAPRWKKLGKKQNPNRENICGGELSGAPSALTCRFPPTLYLHLRWASRAREEREAAPQSGARRYGAQPRRRSAGCSARPWSRAGFLSSFQLHFFVARPREETGAGTKCTRARKEAKEQQQTFKSTMDLRWFLSLVIMACVLRTAPGCPSTCRCYSLTVECGSLGLKVIPQGLPFTTETIFLQDNAIVQIRLQDLTRLGSLHYLYLQNNSVSAVEPGAFLSQGQLLELALNGNLIHLVTADMFRGLEHLRILYLAGNQITRVQDHTFRGLHRLQEAPSTGKQYRVAGRASPVWLVVPGLAGP